MAKIKIEDVPHQFHNPQPPHNCMRCHLEENGVSGVQCEFCKNKSVQIDEECGFIFPVCEEHGS